MMDMDFQTLEAAHEALHRALRLHMRDPNVSLVDLGWRIRDSQGARVDVGDFRVRVHVRQKLRGEAAAMLESAGSFAGTRKVSERDIGFPVDVPQANYRTHSWLGFPTGNPTSGFVGASVARAAMQGGNSIAGAYLASYGTLGGKVIDRRTREAMILSNWHVLVASNTNVPGIPVYQPHRGDPNNIVAHLTRHGLNQHIDAAVATLTNSRRLENDQRGLGPVTGSGWAQPNMAVIKSGARTGITTGMITGTSGQKFMDYGICRQAIRGVVHIAQPLGHENQTVSDRGDSGSWWLEQSSRKVIGLHFAGSTDPNREYALAINMPLVLDALGVDVALN